ncbi:MAG: MarR family transcriptional regulator [Betaproteobacteria bacterium]|nr:MarR family transcriptional regulator [Betaproteobacteria bacterium]
MFDHCIYFNTMALARQLEKEWASAFDPFGLTPPQAFMLRVILERPGLAQCEIADFLAISRPTATRAIDGLAAKKMIERRGSDIDGREQDIYPTATAVDIHASLNEASGKVGKRLKRILGEDVFTDTVKKVRDARTALK